MGNLKKGRAMIASGRRWALRFLLLMMFTTSIFPPVWAAQEPATSNRAIQDAASRSGTETTEEYNRRLQEVLQLSGSSANSSTHDYRIGAEDLLELAVFEAPELDRTLRVSANGQISLPLLGSSQAAGLTSRELEVVIQELLRRSYMKDPHVSVFVKDMQSHPVSVFGAVKKPGVFQIRGSKRLIEVLSMAEGLSDDAGGTVVVMRQAQPAGTTDQMADGGSASAPALQERAGNGAATQAVTGGSVSRETLNINLKDLLNSPDSRTNVLIYPGDVIKVTPAGVVYVVGEVKKPGGFVLKTNENISVLQALALAEGPTRTSARSRVRIIRNDGITGARIEIPIDLGKILAGKLPDPILLPKDIVFVPNSAGRSVLYRGAEAAIGLGTGLAVYRR
jgi:polysaccharide export outer membrane protein